MTRGIREADVENTALHWLRGLGWQVMYGPDLAFGMPQARSGPYITCQPRPRSQCSAVFSTSASLRPRVMVRSSD